MRIETEAAPDDILALAEQVYDGYPTRRLMMSSRSLSTAIVCGHGLLTNNERHFERIEGLNVDNWLK